MSSNSHGKLLAIAGCVALFAGCSINIDEPVVDQPFAPLVSTNEVTLAAGMSEVQAARTDNLSAAVDASRFGTSTFDRVYELETPANEHFSFTLIARGAANFGLTTVSLGHVSDAGLVPDKGPESLIVAGMTLDGSGLAHDGLFVTCTGDGFARMTVSGRIQDWQVLIAQVPIAGGNMMKVGVRISIGAESIINLPNAVAPGEHVGAVKTAIFSSDSWQFGLPALAVSGDRVSVVAYDGDSNFYGTQQRRWLQYNDQTGVVTGGAATSASYDAGSWRDQEVAALGNVLAVVYSGAGQVRAEVSLDRGASFPIEQTLHDQFGWGAQRLVQVAIAPDYRLACLFWSCEYTGFVPTSRLLLVEGTPAGFDANNTPIGYTWAAPVTVKAPAGDVTPLLMHLAYSGGGDLVIGYGYTVSTIVGLDMLTHASFRCAIRMQGQALFTDRELDSEDYVRPADPHVSVIGSGASMQIFYTYEKTTGVHLLYSADAGQNWVAGAQVAMPGAMQPSVLAREVAGNTRVDLLYLAPVGYGTELHCLHWDDFSPGAAGVPSRLTETTTEAGGTPPPDCPQGLTIRTMGNFGYDAVLKDGKVVIVTHEMVIDSYGWWGLWGGGFNTPIAMPTFATTGAQAAAVPPPAVLLPGMGGAVPAPDPNHRNTLSIIVFD